MRQPTQPVQRAFNIALAAAAAALSATGGSGTFGSAGWQRQYWISSAWRGEKHAEESCQRNAGVAAPGENSKRQRLKASIPQAWPRIGAAGAAAKWRLPNLFCQCLQ